MAPESQDNVAKAAAAREAKRSFTEGGPRVDESLDLMRRYLAAVTHDSLRDQPAESAPDVRPEAATKASDTEVSTTDTEPTE